MEKHAQTNDQAVIANQLLATADKRLKAAWQIDAYQEECKARAKTHETDMKERVQAMQHLENADPFASTWESDYRRLDEENSRRKAAHVQQTDMEKARLSAMKRVYVKMEEACSLARIPFASYWSGIARSWTKGSRVWITNPHVFDSETTIFMQAVTIASIDGDHKGVRFTVKEQEKSEDKQLFAIDFQEAWNDGFPAAIPFMDGIVEDEQQRLIRAYYWKYFVLKED